MFKTVFESTGKGIFQVMNNGLRHSVRIARTTIIKKNIDGNYGILNNHDSIIAKDKEGKDIIYMFTSQETSKGLGEHSGKNFRNSLIDSECNIAGQENISQFISSVGISPEEGTVRYSESKRAENYVEHRSYTVAKTLTENYGKLTLKLPNLKKNLRKNCED